MLVQTDSQTCITGSSPQNKKFIIYSCHSKQDILRNVTVVIQWQSMGSSIVWLPTKSSCVSSSVMWLVVVDHFARRKQPCFCFFYFTYNKEVCLQVISKCFIVLFHNVR